MNTENKKTWASSSLTEAHIKKAEQRIDARLRDMAEAGYRQDTIAFTKGQLEDLEATIYDVIYGNPVEAFEVLPLNTSVAAGATSYSYRMAEKTGEAIVVGDGTNDRNIIDSTLTKHLLPIIEVGAAYTYTIGDRESGSIIDFDQVQYNARACAEAIALAHNEFALVGGGGIAGGGSLTKTTGFYNDANVNSATLTDADWTTVTAAGAYDSVTDLIHQVINQSSARHRATNVLFSTFVWNKIASLRLDASTGDTVLRALRANYPDISFELRPSLTGRGAAGVDRMVAYEKRSDRVEYVASVIYDEAAADKQGFRYTTEARGKAAGTVVRYPLSMAYGDITIA